MAASLVNSLCLAVHSWRQARSSAAVGRSADEVWNRLHVLAVAFVAGLTVSVRPCLNAAVLHDSYVAAVLPPDSL
jgi:hypothetical protein